MLDCGMRVSINSDDPAYFGGYIADNYRAVAGCFGLSKIDCISYARNSFVSSFLDDRRKNAYLAELDAYVQSFA